MTSPLRLGILAGEASGDLLGAGALNGFERLGRPVTAVGIGGPALLATGLKPLESIDRFAINGFVEPLRRLPELWQLLGSLEQRLRAERLDAFLGVDFNVFNLLLERRLKDAGVPTAHYVSPSVYAWRRGRIQRLARSTDLLLCLYPFEAPLYAGTPLKVTYVGHPLADQITPVQDRRPAQATARAELGLPAARRCIGLLPGSRSSEVTQMLPRFLEAARLLKPVLNPVTFLLPCPRPQLRAVAERAIEAYPDLDCRIDAQPARRALTAADGALVKSGTSTLEAMLLQCPMVVSYRLGAVSYQMVRRLLRTPYIALPNILAGRALVPELLQDEAEPRQLAAALLAELTRAEQGSEYAEACATLHRQLRCDANLRAAEALAALAAR